MRLDGAKLMDFVKPAFDWWVGELSALMPADLKRIVSRWRRSLVIESGNGRIEVFLETRQGRRAIYDQAFDGADPQAVGSALKVVLKEKPVAVDRIVLRLLPEPVLTRRIRLPYAARNSLREAVGYDLDRQTPFSADQVYYGVKELASDRRAGHVDVALEVVRRDDLDPVLQMLDAAGITLDRAESGPNRPDLLPVGFPRPTGLIAPRLTAGLAGLVVLLMLMAAWLPLERVSEARDVLAPQLKEARSKALAVDELRQELTRLEDRQATLFQRRESEPLLVEIMGSLTEALPSSAFLVELGFQNNELTVSGFAQSASDVLSAIENAQGMSGARFLSPVTQDQRVKRERFSVAVEVTRRPVSTSAVIAEDTP